MATNKIDLNSLDKSDWKTYRFDEIAQNISERVDPNDTDLEVYVGLEHLDSESLHITRHGSPDDVNGTKLRFYKGDIIFGRRRAYQRKAGIATWDGFCSAHALVLRANPEVIHPDLFPFFIHSDLFMNRAVDISVGSLSPTINWGTLKEQEFLIPPMSIQTDIKNLFLVLNKLVYTKTNYLQYLDILLDTVRDSGIKTLEGKLIELEKLILPMSKIKVGKVEKNNYKESGKYPIIDQSQNFIAGYSDQKELVYQGDLPVIIFGDHSTTIKYVNFPFIMGADGTKVIKPKVDINTKFLYHYLINLKLSPQGYRRHFSILKKQKVKICNDTFSQEKLVRKLDIISKQINISINDLESSLQLQKVIINKVF